jgi:methionyl-tRNA formyltransferase
LEIAPCINLHASLLPKYRGASPVHEALLNGDKFTGVTVMLMEEGLDSGDLLSYRYFKIPPNMVLPELVEQLSKDASMLTIETVKQFEKIQPLEQIRAISTHCKKIKRSDGLVNFESAEKLYNRYRAFYGWPTIFLESGLKLLDIRLLDRTSENRAGEILELNKESIVVGCRVGKIEIFKVQPKSKRGMSARAYLVGKGLKVGNSLF